LRGACEWAAAGGESHRSASAGGAVWIVQPAGALSIFKIPGEPGSGDGFWSAFGFVAGGGCGADHERASFKGAGISGGFSAGAGEENQSSGYAGGGADR